MNGKMTTNAQFLITEHKEKIQKQKQTKQATRILFLMNRRNREHMEGYQQGGGGKE